jgi:hypothetical protein
VGLRSLRRFHRRRPRHRVDAWDFLRRLELGASDPALGATSMLRVYDIRGRLLRCIPAGGTDHADWEGRDEAGAPLSAKFAAEIGADAYAFDGANAVQTVESLLRGA